MQLERADLQDLMMAMVGLETMAYIKPITIDELTHYVVFAADGTQLAMFDSAFHQQDEPMIEAVQRRMGQVSDIHALDPVLLSSDAAPVTARRMLTAMIEKERGAQPALMPAD